MPTRLFLVIVLGVTGFTGLAAARMANVVLQDLEARTVQQCAMHDWPVAQDAAHRQFCATYLAER